MAVMAISRQTIWRLKMAYLQKLKLTKEKKRVAVDDEKRRRNKLVEKIEEQKAIAEVGLSGTE